MHLITLSRTLNARFLRRSIYTVAADVAYCCKGSLSFYNKESGDDAYLRTRWIAPGPYQGAALLGVADGVGGWRKYHVDTSRLSKGLAKAMTERFEADEGGDTLPTPRELLTTSFDSLVEQGDSFAGGTTVCFGVFNPVSGQLTVGNIGDSAAIVLRRGKIVYASERDAIGLAPLQLVIPPSYLVEHAKSVYEAAGQTLDKPPWMQIQTEELVIQHYQLEHGDVVLFGSDGIFDNLYNTFINKTVTNAMLANGSWSDKTGEILCEPNAHGQEEIADLLVKRAYYNSLDPHFASPFATKTFQMGMVMPGGKPDDISLVVAIVNSHEQAGQ